MVDGVNNHMGSAHACVDDCLNWMRGVYLVGDEPAVGVLAEDGDALPRAQAPVLEESRHLQHGVGIHGSGGRLVDRLLRFVCKSKNASTATTLPQNANSPLNEYKC